MIKKKKNSSRPTPSPIISTNSSVTRLFKLPRAAALSDSQPPSARANSASKPKFVFFQAEDGIRYRDVTGVQTCALPIWVQAAIQFHDPHLHAFLQQQVDGPL